MLLLGLTTAGTVTLTGTCTREVLNGNTVLFSISNSGNDTAFNLILTPTVNGAHPTKSFYTLNSLPPDSQASINITLENVTARGTYASYFTTAYQQSGSTFTAVFPCLLDFFNSTSSQVLLSSNFSLGTNGTAVVSVSAFNAGRDTITVNISLILPPTFSYVSNPYHELSLAPYKTENVSFYLNFPNTDQASYSAAAVVSYAKNNLGYAYLTTFVMSLQKPRAVNLGLVLVAGVIIIIVVLLALLLFILIRRSRRSA